VGAATARGQILGAAPVAGRAAARLGLVQWAVPAEELAESARALAQSCAAMPRLALAENKRCIALASAPHGDGFAAEIAATRRLYEHPETRRRVSAFLDKRATHAKEKP
jgi:enoyl-CoA hydratase/carnithine racemase